MNPKASFENRFRSKLRRIIPLLIRDNSANKLLFASLLKFESYYPPLRGIVQLTNFPTLRYENWSFTNKKEVLLTEIGSLNRPVNFFLYC